MHSLIWPMPIRVCDAEQGVVFKVVSLKQGQERMIILSWQGIQFHYWVSVLNRASFWTGNFSKSVKTCDKRSTFEISIMFFLNIYFHDFRVKNYLILYAKQNKSGSESSVSCLNQGSKMSNFCLKQGRGLRASAGHLYPGVPWVPPPPPPPSIAVIAKRLTLKYSYTFDQLEAHSACSGRTFRCVPHTKSGPKKRTEAREEKWRLCGWAQGVRKPRGETPHMKGVGMLVENFELNP